MKILTIGDPHGKDDWLKFADLNILLNTPNLSTDFDYYIFTGDYVDSFTKTNEEIYDNLKKIIQLKENYPKKVITLLGNHDIQYMYIDNKLHLCSGFRSESFRQLNELFSKHKDKFQLAFQIDNYLWTHAGIHNDWYLSRYPYSTSKLADSLNKAFKNYEQSLFDVGRLRGGNRDVGGPLWCDKRKSSKNPLKGYHQIVGHHPVEAIETIRVDNNTSITYCDCIEHGNGDYYILDTEDLWWPINYDKNRKRLKKTQWKLCKDLTTSHIQNILKDVKEGLYKISSTYQQVFEQLLKDRNEILSTL